MKPALLATSLCLGFGILPAFAQENVQNLMAGPPGSAISVAAADIVRFADNCGLKLAPVESQGSLENLLAINVRPDTPLAIVQGDFLEYLKTFAPDDPRISEKIAQIGVVAPLFSQDVHIVARRDIGSVAALTGRKVAIGGPESGSFLTARVIFDLLHVKPGEYVETAPETALGSLKSGEIDAVFVVENAPSALLAGAGLEASAFHLLSLDDPVLAVAYPRATIPGGTYEIAKEDTIAVRVPTVMIAFDYDAVANGAEASANCRAVAGLTNILTNRREELSGLEHPFWTALDTSQPVPDWPRTDCAEQGLKPDFVLECKPAAP